jgi:hypothetical protein
MKRKIDKKSINWAKKNKWFGEDQYKTYYAFDVHALLIKNNIDPETKSYYKIIDGFMSHYNETKKMNTKRMKITRDQVRIARRLGVPLEKWVGHR